MRRNKKGFTLGEVLVCIMIIGIIMALSVNAIKIVRASYTSLTYFAFNNVQNMVGVLIAGAEAGIETEIIEKVKDDGSKYNVVGVKDTFINSLKDKDGKDLPPAVGQCRRADGSVVQVLKSDTEYDNNIGIPNCSARASSTGNAQNLFCKSLVSISNTSGKTDCENLATADYDTEPYISNLNYNKPNFITTNGQRYYISKWTYNSKVSTEYGYRLIAVDLNGKTVPNKSGAGTSAQPPDIVTFLVLDNGEVFPLGVAADNKKAGDRTFRYLNSKVKGYYYSYVPDRKDNIPQECTVKTSTGSTQTCNYAVVYLQNDDETSFFSYRQAYCKSLGNKVNAYENYCKDIAPSKFCPPSNEEKAFDLCLPHNIKPLFRYNFK